MSEIVTGAVVSVLGFLLIMFRAEFSRFAMEQQNKVP